MKRNARIAAILAAIVAAHSLPASAQVMGKIHISDDAAFRRAQQADDYSAAPRQPFYGTSVHVSDDSAYRRAQQRVDYSDAPRKAVVASPVHISDDAEYRRAQAHH